MYRLGIIALVMLAACQSKEAPQEFSFKKKQKPEAQKASTLVDLKSKGTGPISFVDLSNPVDPVMVREGQSIYEQKCTACHKIGTTFIGPPPNGILKRRTPEWIMNMILNPDEMLQKDSLAKALFMEFNGQLMTNQRLSEAEARAILEYFRML